MQHLFSLNPIQHTNTHTHAWVCFKAHDVFVWSPGLCFFFSLFLIFFYFILLLFDLSLISGKDYCNSQLSLENCQHVTVLVWVFSESRARDEDLGAVSRKWKCWRERMRRGGVWGVVGRRASGGSLLSWSPLWSSRDPLRTWAKYF